MPVFARLFTLLIVALSTATHAASAADTPQDPPAAGPSSTATPAPAPAPTQAPAPAPAAPPAPASPVDDADIRATFTGKAACPPEPWPISVGPWEFHAGGNYVRVQDLASAFGRYAIADGKICVTLAGSDKADFCLAVLKRGDGYLFRLDTAAGGGSRHDPVPVTPCPLPQR
jgi:hypothetical protein